MRNHALPKNSVSPIQSRTKKIAAAFVVTAAATFAAARGTVFADGQQPMLLRSSGHAMASSARAFASTHANASARARTVAHPSNNAYEMRPNRNATDSNGLFKSVPFQLDAHVQPTPIDRGITERRTRSGDIGVRAVALGINEQIATGSIPMLARGEREYYDALSRRMSDGWTPPRHSAPSMHNAMMSGPRHLGRPNRPTVPTSPQSDLSRGPDSPVQNLMITDYLAHSGSSGLTLTTIVEVDQVSSGRVSTIRVVQSSNHRAFDEAAVAAANQAFNDIAPLPSGQGRRSRWEFAVNSSRDAAVPFALTFDETSGTAEPRFPGAVHYHRRVRALGGRPLNVEWQIPRPIVD